MLPVRPPMRRHPSAIPLANMAGCWMVANCPHLPARAATIPRQHDTGRRPRGDSPYSRARSVGLRGNRHGYRKQSSQGQSERPHFGTPVIHRLAPPSHNGSTVNFRPAGTRSNEAAASGRDGRSARRRKRLIQKLRRRLLSRDLPPGQSPPDRSARRGTRPRCSGRRRHRPRPLRERHGLTRSRPTTIRVFLRSSIRPCRPASKR